MSERCPLCPGTANCIKGSGPVCNDYGTWIGEAPGKDEKTEPFCFEESTPVLTAGLEWVPISSLKIGDKLLAFDEFSDVRGTRRWKVSEVTAVHKSIRDCLRINTDKTAVFVTSDHLLLCMYPKSGKKKQWRCAGSLKSGNRQSAIAYIGSPWMSSDDYNSGWLSGFLNGEGHITFKGDASYVGFSQNSGDLCREAVHRFCIAGYKTSLNGEARKGGKICEHHLIRGGFLHTLRLLGTIQPSRLIHNLVFRRESMPEFRTEKALVISVAPAGSQAVVDITTTTGTFIASGLAVHNCGKTGREVNEGYFPLAGMRRPSVRVTNAIRCLPNTPKHKLEMKKQLHKDLLMSCAEHHLYPELAKSKPRIIVPMGAFACYAIDPGISLEMQHGLPVQTAWGTAFPMYHPAGGIHEPKKMLQIRTDWVRLRKYMKGALTLPIDAYPNPDYRECETPGDLDDYMAGMEDYPSAFDTEITRSHVPYCATLSVRPGTGRLIRATNLSTLQRLQYWIDRWRGRILFHNWLFDGEVVEAMGLNFPWRRIVDTMVKVFQLGNLPQGLKALSFRELGMIMQDFDDLVTPHSLPLVLEYYGRAMAEDWSVPSPELVRTDDGGYKVYKPHGFRTKLKTFWNAYSKNPDKEVFEQWTKNWVDHQAEVEKVLGPWPGKCITHVPFEKVLHYACRDADATLRLWPVIQHMQRRVRRYPQESWRDAA